MGGGIASLAVGGALLLASASACAMSSPPREQARCTIIDGAKLPPASGGADALCAAIRDAMARQLPGTEVTVEVRVLSPSRLRATLTTSDGRKLDDQNYAISDRALGRDAFERFASGLAQSLAEQARQ
jgi:hypothetical protein